MFFLAVYQNICIDFFCAAHCLSPRMLWRTFCIYCDSCGERHRFPSTGRHTTLFSPPPPKQQHQPATQLQHAPVLQLHTDCPHCNALWTPCCHVFLSRLNLTHLRMYYSHPRNEGPSSSPITGYITSQGSVARIEPDRPSPGPSSRLTPAHTTTLRTLHPWPPHECTPPFDSDVL